GPEVSSSLQTKYYTLTESGQAGIEAATATLHALFVQATEHVLANQESLAPYFHIPAALWPRIQDSWARQYVIKNDTISGRLDFALTDHGIKVYEYNADSASCLMECGYTQDAWSNAAGLGSIGRSNSSTLFTQLTAAWKSKNVQGTLHLLCDNDPEERYHSLYMKATAEAAGIPCVLVVGVQDLHFDSSDGTTILDGQNRPLRNVWKTWAWQTVISQYEARNAGAAATSGAVQVMDVMLHPSVRVFEPLWTVLPSSKAILPILTQLAPDNPYLLRSTFDPADIPLFTGGYVAKPVMGRTGANVSIYNGSGDLISATAGKWVDDTIVYQEIALLPKYEDDCYVQVNTWAIDGEYGGTVLRIDESNIVGLNSGIYPMRVVPDKCLSMAISASSVLPKYLNAVKKDLAVHTLNIARHVGNARYLDASLPFVPTFEAKYGHEVSTAQQSKYYTITEAGQAGVEAATDILHQLFLRATDHVLAHKRELAPYFCIPAGLWPKIQHSWTHHKQDTISGRLDFALTDQGMKVYEYNADSASCLMECGYTQDAWSNAAGLGSIGRSNSSTLFTQLTAAWKSKNVQGTLHLLCDDDDEERYHSLYMKAAAEAAGIPSVLIVGVQDLHFDSSDGTTILDGQNRPLRNVWKTWAWQTVISQYEARNAGAAATSGAVQVMDVMLHPSVRVFEPLWTVLPSSKAILPILTQLAPDNPYLLRSTFDPADIPLFTGGYVAKPVMGRTGANVSIYNGSGDLISATAGKWVD
ncbi:hypothetical protein DYB26_014554, partial [Aphanomyces astaci]